MAQQVAGLLVAARVAVAAAGQDNDQIEAGEDEDLLPAVARGVKAVETAVPRPPAAGRWALEEPAGGAPEKPAGRAPEKPAGRAQRRAG